MIKDELPNLENLSKMIDKRLDLVNGIVKTIRDTINMFPANDIFGLGPFVLSYEDALKKMVSELKEKLPEDEKALLGDEGSAILKIALTHMYLREVQLMRKEKAEKVAEKSPNAEFLAAARKCLYTLHNIPDTGGVMTEEQEDDHLNSAMTMAQALKKFEGKQS
jgi:hypothetical protein